MRSQFLSSSRCQVAARVLLAGLAALVCGSLSAQNLLKNPGFESPIEPPGSAGTNNWTVVYVYGGPSDLSIADRSTFASRGSGGFGAHLRSIHDGLFHAYFKQTVSGLTPGARYALSGYMRYWEFTFELNKKFDVYFESLGGQGTTATPSITAMDDPNLKTNAVYRVYSVTNTADARGQIEVRLHLNRYATTVCCDKLYYINGLWDDMSLTLTP
jgi:hypothetical protein